MKNKRLKKIAAYTGGTILFLALALAVHIYIVTRPGKPTERTRIMARVDIKQTTTPDDANKYVAWFYQQKGVAHVFCNPKSDILVFSFSPLQANANAIINNFKTDFHVQAVRFMPSAGSLAGSCPMGYN
jgi:hypothetical protein